MPGQLTKRDTFKNQSYFDDEARYNAEKLDEFRAIIADPTTTSEHRLRLRHTVVRRELEQLIIRYSRGEPVSAMRAAFPAVIDALTIYQQDAGRGTHDFDYFDAYVYALWLVSLAILLDVPDVMYQRVVDELDNQGRDALFDRLVAVRRPGPMAATLMYPDPYEPLLRALDAQGERRTSLIREFLTRYYDGMRDAYWYNSHQGDDAGFFGYWCFELAAFVDALDFDDTAFVDNVHYPRDLVHAQP